MASQRKLIREAVIQRLKDANTRVSDRVFGNRVRPIFQQEVPCIVVYTKSDNAEISNESPREYKRTLSIVLELVSKSDEEETLDGYLDEFCSEVETAIFQEETFSGLVSDTILGDTEIDILVDGEKPIGAAKINLVMPYYEHLPSGPASPFDDFETANVVYDLESVGSQTEAEDEITLPIV